MKTLEQRFDITIEKLRHVIHAADPSHARDLLRWLSASAYDRDSKEWHYFEQAMNEEAYHNTISMLLQVIYDGLEGVEGASRGVTDFFFHSSDSGSPRCRWFEVYGCKYANRPSTIDETIQINLFAYDQPQAKKMASEVTSEATRLARFWWLNQPCRWTPEISSYMIRIQGSTTTNRGTFARESMAFAEDNRRRIDERIQAASRAIHYVSDCWKDMENGQDHSDSFWWWATETHMIFLLRTLLNIPAAKDWPQIIHYDEGNVGNRSLAERIRSSRPRQGPAPEITRRPRIPQPAKDLIQP